MSDFQQMKELQEERMQEELRHLVKLDQLGMHEVAEFFAADLGITKEFQQEKTRNQG